jgi:chromosome segregation ATPase
VLVNTKCIEGFFEVVPADLDLQESCECNLKSDKLLQAKDVILYDPYYEKIIDLFLDGIVIFDGEDHQLPNDLINDDAQFNKLVTIDGKVIHKDGVIEGGASLESAELFKNLEKIKSLKRNIEDSELSIKRIMQL